MTVAPLEQTLVFTQNSFLQPTGTPLASFTQLETLPLSLRSPASVSFTATASDRSGADIGDVTLAQDASIVTDPGASVLLAANGYNGNVRVFGTILAPGGNITLQLENPLNPLQSGVDPGYIAGQEILLGPAAVLAAPGFAELNTLNPLAYTEGSVLPGGTVSLLANKGYVQTDYGSVVNVSGTVATLDIVNTNGVNQTTEAANAGTINIDAREGIVLQGNLLAQPASLNGAPFPGAAGGTLNVVLGYNYSDSGSSGTGANDANGGALYPTPTRTLTLAGVGPNGSPAVPPSNQLQSGTGVIDASSIESGGFANVALSSADTIVFAGALTLAPKASLTLDAPLFQASPSAQATLSAPYVAVGNYLNNSEYYDVGAASPNAPAVLNPVPGTATLDVNAQLIDIRGISGWSGFAQENFTSAGDIRFIGGDNAITAPPSINVPGGPSFEGGLITSATLDLRGAQLYPTTATAFAIDDLPPSGTSSVAPAATEVTIGSSLPTTSPTPATPLSAGGSLSINATTIDQYGVLRAPMGQIALNGVSITDAEGNVTTAGSVTLEDGSLTSVSAGGLIIPYGSTVNGTQWTYTPAAGYSDVVSQPPAKQISLNAPNVNVEGAAKLDLSGGGDLYAYEFIAGEGGSVDVLDPANLPAAAHPAGMTVYTYAILPTLGSSFAPFDAQFEQGSSVPVNQTITLSGVPGLAAGTYALLPAPYALLPGAYAIQVVQANSNLAPGSSVAQPNGAYEVSARFGVAGTSILSSLTSTVLVASDATVRTESQYTDSYANAFFSAAALASDSVAPPLPADAGQLLLSATNQLNFNGSVNFATASFSTTNASGTTTTQQGLGGDVGITAPNIVVVNPTGPQTQVPAGTVQLNVQQLDNLDAQTLIIGASSTTTAAGVEINVGATQTVELKNTTPLTAPEIILAAQDSVTVDPNAQITTSAATAAASSQTPLALLLPGGGALLRVSNGPAATLTVDPTTLPQTPTGTVAIGAAATVEAAGSLLLYGTNTTTIAPGALVSAPAVSLYSSLVSLGEVPAGTAGLTLTSQLLGSLRGLTDLVIGSSSTIDFYGPLQLGTAASSTPNLDSLTLDASGLGGYDSGNKVLQANDITLTNSSGSPATFAAAPDGTGSLTLIASGIGVPQVSASGGTATVSGQLTLAATSNTVSGFSALNLQAAGDIVGQGTGSLTVVSSTAVPVTLTSAAVVGTSGSDQTLTTTGAVTIAGSAPNPKLTLPAPGLGAELAVQASAITQNGTVDLPAGIVSLNASSGDITLGKGSVTSAAGAVQGYTVASAAAPGGQISLAAQAGNVTIGAGATVDVSGASTTGTSAVSGDAGSLTVSAPLGTFAFAGSTLKGGAAAGQAQGGFTLDEGSGLGGSGFAALAAALGGGGFTGAVDLRTRNDPSVTIANAVQAGSFELTVDTGSIEVTGTAVINTSGGTPLNTDGGSIALWAGTGLTLDAGAHLLANAGTGGPAGTNGAALLATGGNITLGTSSGTLAIAGGTSQDPTTISMQGGGAAATDGTLTLRAPRTPDDMNVQIQVQNAASIDLVTRNPVVVEGFKTYSATDLGSTDAGCGTGGSCDIADLNGMLYTDAAAFVGNSPAIAAGLGFPSVQIRPGIEVDSAGDLILDNSTPAWDLASWNAGLGVPVNLTLRAAGNLIFEASLSDGFTNNGSAVANWTFGEPGTATGSASYTLTAGADLSSANPLAVIAQPAPAPSLGAPPNAGNVILTPGNLIRTGSGNIAVAAGGDVLLGYGVGDANGNLYDNGTLQVAESDPLTSAIYTAGVPSVLTAAQAALFVPTTPPRAGRGGVAILPSYPTYGGNISLSASDDIRSAASAQLISDWLWRRGPVNGAPVGPDVNTSWWIQFNEFDQGIGVLGGGNLSLRAGRDIVNTSAVIPTTGRLLVAAGGTPVASDVLLTGGGNLQVQAGGNIVSGVFEDDWGNASLSAGGAVTSSTDSTLGQEITTANLQQLSSAPPPLTTEVYPILAVGNGVFNVNARAGIAIDAVVNSTTLPITAANFAENNETAAGSDAAFFAYAPTANPSTLNLVSAGGVVTLAKDPAANLPLAVLSAQSVYYENSEGITDSFAIYPSTLNVASLSGDIDLGDPLLAQTEPNGVAITLFPAANGNLKLLAAGSVNNDGQQYSIVMSQADPTQVPSALAPGEVSSYAALSGVPLPQTPLHQNDAQPVSIVANTGDIGSGGLTFPKAANIIAGANITDLNYVGSNLNPSDVTLIAAGGDIDFSTPTQAVTNALLPNPNGIELAGPGHLEVLAGGSVNLGDSNGILTTGSLSDTRLPVTGASMVVGAGLGMNADGGLRQPAYQNFITAYLAPNATTDAPSIYASTLVSYMQALNPTANASLAYPAALTSFEALTPAQQLPLLAQVLSDELSATGLAHTLQGASYTRGYAAINTLFPATENGQSLAYDGDLNMAYSQLKTEQGGDIDLLVPGGSVVVGFPNPPASLSILKQTITSTGLTVPAAVNLGILVLGEGAVQGFADEDFTVNQSRILTLEGGDIILWASNGNIDAGKGAKSASGAPPPVISTDANGNLFVNPSNSVSGSGIGQLLTTPGLKAGLVNLIAPKGDVNAGDAGIRVAGNLNIAAVQVIGAGNITVVGTATGVPVSEAGAFAGALSGANSLGDASKSAIDQLSQDLNTAASYQELSDSLAPTFIVVKMFCLGIECETQ
ncbi:MAG: filamentous hemagglutinin family protein [Steroidobacteraceae bacterium]